MSEKLILEIFVELDVKDISQVESSAGGAVMIPFRGTAAGEIFKGTVLPGGVDTQTVDLNGVRHMSARYMLEGVDETGEQCRIFVENEGWFSKAEDGAMPFKTVPRFLTNSKTLSPYLHQPRFRGEGHPAPSGVTIKFFDIQA